MRLFVYPNPKINYFFIIKKQGCLGALSRRLPGLEHIEYCIQVFEFEGTQRQLSNSRWWVLRRQQTPAGFQLSNKQHLCLATAHSGSSASRFSLLETAAALVRTWGGEEAISMVYPIVV